MTNNLDHLSYASGKLSEAVRALVIGEGDIKARLKHATDYLWAVNPDMLPAEIKPHLVWISEQLTRVEPIGNEGAVAATLRRIRRSTGATIAERILLIHSLTKAHLDSKNP